MHNSADHTDEIAASASVHSGGIAGATSAASSPSEKSVDSGTEVRQPAGHLLDLSHKDHADKVLKELSMNDFLSVVERSTPEELELMLRNASPVKHPVRSRSLLPTLAARFFALGAPRPGGAVETFCWWEARRIQYNLLVGAAGLCTLAVIQACGFGGSIGAYAFAAMSYGMMANICYSSGWLSELIARHFWKEKAEHFGPILYCQGVAFSVLLTLAPAALAVAAILLRFVP